MLGLGGNAIVYLFILNFMLPANKNYVKEDCKMAKGYHQLAHHSSKMTNSGHAQIYKDCPIIE